MAKYRQSLAERDSHAGGLEDSLESFQVSRSESETYSCLWFKSMAGNVPVVQTYM